jgi:arylformamidase
VTVSDKHLTNAPTLVYVHCGYWQRGDKSIYSFLVSPFNDAGVNVVILGYDLCPTVTITRISEDAREAICFLWLEANALGINRNQITVMGHSAGGHITQMMMTTHWPVFDSALPADLVKAGIPISPLNYLEPVRLTEALNASLHMDPQEAYEQSPMTTQHPPITNAPQLVVGGAETLEFHRQMTI